MVKAEGDMYVNNFTNDEITGFCFIGIMTG